MKELKTEIEIDAPPDRVWEVLTDFGAYPEWNPFIRSVEGEASVGSRLKVRIEPPGGRAMTFRPTMRAVERRASCAGRPTADTGTRRRRTSARARAACQRTFEIHPE